MNPQVPEYLKFAATALCRDVEFHVVTSYVQVQRQELESQTSRDSIIDFETLMIIGKHRETPGPKGPHDFLKQIETHH